MEHFKLQASAAFESNYKLEAWHAELKSRLTSVHKQSYRFRFHISSALSPIHHAKQRQNGIQTKWEGKEKSSYEENKSIYKSNHIITVRFV
jgi:hypothetical protein